MEILKMPVLLKIRLRAVKRMCQILRPIANFVYILSNLKISFGMECILKRL